MACNFLDTWKSHETQISQISVPEIKFIMAHLFDYGSAAAAAQTTIYYLGLSRMSADP